MPRPPRQRRERVDPYSTWVNAPLQNMIRDELDRQRLSISDLGRMIHSQPSLISRWMQGSRPNPESINIIAEALGLDQLTMLKLAGHITAPLSDEELPPEVRHLRAKIALVDMSGERYRVLANLLDSFLRNPLAPRDTGEGYAEDQPRPA